MTSGSLQEWRDQPHPAEPIWTGRYVALLSPNLLLCFEFCMLRSTLPAHVGQHAGLAAMYRDSALVLAVFIVLFLVGLARSSSAAEAPGTDLRPRGSAGVPANRRLGL